MGITFESTFDPPEHLLKDVKDCLGRFNDSVIGNRSLTRLASFARDDSQELIGGISGWLFWDWLYIDLLWVEDGHRRKGIGKRLLQEAEQMARDRGVAVLDWRDFL